MNPHGNGSGKIIWAVALGSVGLLCTMTLGYAAGVSTQIDNLRITDSTTLQRVSTLEEQVKGIKGQLDRIERKVDLIRR